MSSFVQILESRRLLSVSPLVVTLHGDEASVKTAFKTIESDGGSHLKTITADFKAAGLQVTDKAQIKALSKDFGKFKTTVNKAIAAATSKVNADAAHLLSAEAQLAKKPGNEKLTAKVAADQTALSADAAAKLGALQSAFQGTALIADLQTVIGDGGTVGSDAGTALTVQSTEGMLLNMASTQAYLTDVDAFLPG
jgi:hypothetical protein